MSIGSSLLQLAAEWECFHSQRNCWQPQSVKTSQDKNYVLQHLQKSRNVNAGRNSDHLGMTGGSNRSIFPPLP